MNFYFVDYENLAENVFELIRNWNRDSSFKTFLVIRENTKHDIDLNKISHIELGEIEVIRCKGKKKELVDNILCSRLGFFIAAHEYNNKDASFTIISSDNGFQEVADYWAKFGYDVKFQYITSEQKKKAKEALKKMTK